MASLTLGELIQRDPSLGGLRIDLPASGVPAERRAQTTVHHLADVGQRVTFLPDASRTPELGDEERQRTYVVKATIGAGEEQFVRLTTLDGLVEVGWFQVKQLMAARATNANPILPDGQQQEDDTMNPKTTETGTEKQAAQFKARVAQHFTHTRDWTKAFHLAQHEDAVGAEAYRLAPPVAPAVEPEPVLSLSDKGGSEFDKEVARRVAAGATWRQATHDAGIARPDLAAAR